MLPSYIRIVASLHSRYRFQGPVCSIGNQDIWASYEDLRRYFKEVGCPYVEPLEIIGHSSRTFNIDKQLSRIARRFVHASVFFHMLGITNYTDLDKFDSDNPALVHDLNLRIPSELENQFGLVFDGGTVEHIFDVRQVMENISLMVKLHGCVIHICSYQIDHGFFAFSPSFLYDFYAANGFSHFECFLMEVDFSDIIRTYARKHRYVEYHYGMSLDGLIDSAEEILIFFVARKLENIPKLVVPTQGIYSRRGNAMVSSSEYPEPLFERVVPGWLKPLASPARPLLRTVYRAYKRIQLRRNTHIGHI